MSVQFYPKVEPKDRLDSLYLDVSSFNAQDIFIMLNIEGTGENGTIGELNTSEIKDALNHMSNFDRWAILDCNKEQTLRHVTKLNFILGFCLGNKCNFCWS